MESLIEYDEKVLYNSFSIERIILFGLEVVGMKLLLEGKNGNKDMILENVKEYNECVHDRKIYVSYNDDRENESYSMIQYMAVPLN